MSLDGEGTAAKPFDGREDVVGGLGPAEGLGVGVAGVDIGGDCCFQLLDGAVSTALDLLFGEEREEPLDLVDPGRGGWREVGVPAGPLGEPVADQFRLVARGVVDDDVDVKIGRHVVLDRIEKPAELLRP